VKRTSYLLAGLVLSLALLLNINSFIVRQTSQKNALIGHLVSVPAANDPALQKAAQQKQQNSAIASVSPLVTTTYVDVGNWAGYVIGSGSGNGFKGVEANWNAPCKSGTVNSQIGYGSWVGLGGAFGNGVFANSNGVEPLEQAGIILQSDGTYRMFWEYVSSNEPPLIDTQDVIRCGQSITAWVHYGSSYCSNGGFYAHVQDNTTGSHLGSTCLTRSQGLGVESAEWIDERPSVGNCNQQLADFNYTQWSNVLGQTNVSGSGWSNPNNFVNRQLFMFSGTTELADPDGLSVASNNTFTDRWYANGAYCV
jgi:hypothetical protein